MSRPQLPLCTCGHADLAHEHYRSGSDCGVCGPDVCARFQRTPNPERTPDPERTPLMPDHAAPDSTIEAKVFASSAVSLLASLVVAWLNGVQDNPSLLGALDPTWQFVILTAVPPLLTFAAGWAKTSNRA